MHKPETEIIGVIALGLKKFGEGRGAKIKENAPRREQLSCASYNLTYINNNNNNNKIDSTFPF